MSSKVVRLKKSENEGETTVLKWQLQVVRQEKLTNCYRQMVTLKDREGSIGYRKVVREVMHYA